MSNKIVSHEIRFRVDPGDIPAEKAARRLHISLVRFNELLPNLLKRGFPAADPDTGNFDLDAIDQWRRLRNPHLFSLAPAEKAEEPAGDRGLSLGDRFVARKAAADAARQAQHGRPKKPPGPVFKK
ncbi:MULTISPECIES: hypothetical protein [unclassified Afipia]|uniref:hypothetical protein n=1 Tax=unclassified Afipia TaxID=2642050 RepID=UPI00126914A4|nr:MULTISPECIES: hypothetical protein [unclassified Afipia]